MGAIAANAAKAAFFRDALPQGCKHPCGALAQLGERLICIQEVIGSIPIGSTTSISRSEIDECAAKEGC